MTQGAPQLGPPRSTGAGHARGLHRRGAAARGARRRRRLGPDALADDAALRHRRGRRARRSAPTCAALGEGVPPGVGEADRPPRDDRDARGRAPARRASMLDVLRTFVRAKNGGTRYEDAAPHERRLGHEAAVPGLPGLGARRVGAARRAAGSGRPSSRSSIAGSRSTRSSAESRDEDWSPIDAFCARHRIPAVLPQTPLPPARPAGDGFYSLYFSRGVVVEAQAIAQSPGRGARRRRSCGSCRDAAPQARRRRRSWRARSSGRRAHRVRPAAAALTAETWRALIGGARRLVLWLDGARPGGPRSAGRLGSARRGDEVYLSSTLLGEAAAPAAGAARRARGARPPVRDARRVRPARGPVARCG